MGHCIWRTFGIFLSEKMLGAVPHSSLRLAGPRFVNERRWV